MSYEITYIINDVIQRIEKYKGECTENTFEQKPEKYENKYYHAVRGRIIVVQKTSLMTIRYRNI